MARFFSHPRFLQLYSAILTIVFASTTACNFWLATRRVYGAEQHLVDFDQLTVHRINIVEPDGTPRPVISDKAEFPGSFYGGREISRPDRASVAGMLFMDDEGTEDGGLIFGGYKDAQGQFHSSGHLSFDDYEQDQSMSLDSYQDGGQHRTAYRINDNRGTLLTPEVLDAFAAVNVMPNGPSKRKARAAVMARYPFRLIERADLVRGFDNSAMLRLCDPDGHVRILLRVAPDGTPSMQFLDASGKVTHQWPESPSPSQGGK